MPISELTKIEVANRRASLRQQFQKNKTDIQSHRDAIDVLVARNQALKARAGALEADIPEPTPVPEAV